MAVDPRDFALNTDYEMDKIVVFKQGQFTDRTEFQHGLGFTPLPFGVWSTDSNFSSSNSIGVTDPIDEPGYTPVLGVNCYADSSKIWLGSAGNTNNATIYYRVYGFEPHDSTNTVPHTNDKAKQFILNTDYNYNKLFKRGAFTQDYESFQHNLGYLPQVMAWFRLTSNQRVYPFMQHSEFSDVRLSVDTSKIQTGIFWAGLFDKIYWRIYYDEA